ncbi:hypothetical protein PSTT_09946 [Puccinia striiformis]|uniref:Uncharacterized protein n=1 Tax=Puccinia striiformis TaxID=27350 RepID=A0A2S4V6B5_9BASI|nr:hypothetical protein PSTT_09946 [Puccinia striiformis]
MTDSVLGASFRHPQISLRRQDTGMPGSIGSMAIPVPALAALRGPATRITVHLNTWIPPTAILNILIPDLTSDYPLTSLNLLNGSDHGHIVFLTATYLLHACNAYDTSDPNIKCVPKIQTGRANCKRYTLIDFIAAVTSALQLNNSDLLTCILDIPIPCEISAYLKIRYEPDSTLDKFPGHTEKISGNCVIMVDRPYQLSLPKQVIEDGFAKMLSHCKEHPGTYMLPGYKDVKLSTRQRAPLPTIEDDSPLIRHFALGERPSKPRGLREVSFTGLRTDGQHNFLDHNGDFANNVYNVVKSCHVIINSSDGSVVTIKKPDAAILAYRTVAKCNYKWGAITLRSGVDGTDGRLIMTFLPTGIK